MERTEGFVRGHANEIRAGRRWEALGFAVVPLYAIDTSGDDGARAPHLFSRFGTRTLPDLLVGTPGFQRFVEVKLKGRSDVGKISKRPEHGIPLQHLEDYIDVENFFGVPALLEITEEETGEILIARVNRLSYRESSYKGTPMAYLFRDEFLPFDTFIAAERILT